MQDVVLLQAQLEREQEPTSYGIPVSIAYDSDSDPMNRDSPTRLESFYYRDHAAALVRTHQQQLQRDHGEHATDDLVFGVWQVPRTTPPPTGG